MAGGGGQQDAGDVERVQDLLRLVPQAGGFEELDVKPGAMTHGLAAAQEVGQEAERGVRVGGPLQLLLLDPGEAEDCVGNGPPGIDQLLEGRGDLVRGEGHGSDFDDSVPSRVETRGLKVQGGVLQQRRVDSRNPGGRNLRGRIGSEPESRNVICAPDGNRGDRGS